MTPVRACIGLGSNIGDGVRTLSRALDAIDALDGVRLVAVSPFYRSPAWGVTEQADFINAAVSLDTTLEAGELLDALLAIERRFGRDRGADAQRWGPRTLDLDLLLHGDAVIDAPGLRVPHPHLHERAFALRPLLDVWPDAVIPGIGVARALLAGLEADAATLQAIDALPYAPPRTTRD